MTPRCVSRETFTSRVSRETFRLIYSGHDSGHSGHDSGQTVDILDKLGTILDKVFIGMDPIIEFVLLIKGNILLLE
jgi:hypothetical protein